MKLHLCCCYSTAAAVASIPPLPLPRYPHTAAAFLLSIVFTFKFKVQNPPRSQHRIFVFRQWQAADEAKLLNES